MQRRRIRRVTTAGLAAAAVASLVAACGSSGSSGSSSSSSSSSSSALSGTLNGSGSTLQLTFQQAAIQGFKSVQSGMTVNYGAGGSGKGRTDLAGGTVNYAGSDSPIPSDETASFKGKTVLYFPDVIAPVTVSYNLPGVKSLKLAAPAIAGIFQGTIKTWNDPAIKADNPGISLPSTPVTIAHRSDSSGTTANFSNFLVKATGDGWKLDTGSTINWPAASRGGNGNGGVAQIIKSTTGAVGYVDYSDAKASGLTYASIKNQAGQYVVPSVSSAAAAASQTTVAPDLTFSAIWAPGAASYPITAQSWVLVYQAQSSKSTAKMLQAWVGYLVGAGQQLLPSLGFAPVPSKIDQMAKAQISKIGS
jgi:phosphate transport system substrate-binding protein